MVAEGDSGRGYAQRLGIHKDQVVQELGWDEDADDDIRADVEDACGAEILYEDADEVIDVVLNELDGADGCPATGVGLGGRRLGAEAGDEAGVVAGVGAD